MTYYKTAQKNLELVTAAFNKVKEGMLQEAQEKGSVAMTANDLEMLFQMFEAYTDAHGDMRIQEFK